MSLRRSKRWIAGAAVLGVIAAFGLSRSIAPRLYVARTALVFDLAVPASEIEASRQLRTMVDGITLPENLLAIRDRLGLTDDLTDVADRLTIDYDRDSNLVTISATDVQRERSAEIANTAAAVFVDHRRAFEAERRKEVVQALDEDLGRARDELAATREEYDAFRRANGIADLSTETQRAIEAAAALRAQADLAQGEVAAEQSRTRTLRPRALPPTPAAEASAEQRAVETRLAQARLELVEARARFSSEHPEVQRLESMVASLRSQRVAAPPPVPPPSLPQSAAPRPVLRPAGPSGRTLAARERQRTYERLANEAQARVQKLSAQQGEAARLLAAQQVAEAHLSELTALRSRAIDEARSPVTGLRVLSKAVPPERAQASVAQPMLFVLLPLAFALLATFTIVARRLFAMRIHTAREAAFWGKGATVASTGWPREDEPLDGLLAELGDGASHARGSTLVVAASSDDAFLACELAADLNAATGRKVEDGTEHAAEVVLTPPAPVRRPTIPLGLPGADLDDIDAGSNDIHHRATAPFATATGAPAGGALARRFPTSRAVRLEPGRRSVTPTTFKAWGGPTSGASLRRLARLVDRVLVLVRSGSTTIQEITKLREGIGRESGVGYVVVDLDESLQDLPDRAGSVDGFWRGSKE